MVFAKEIGCTWIFRCGALEAGACLMGNCLVLKNLYTFSEYIDVVVGGESRPFDDCSSTGIAPAPS